ncbi:ABC transporter ATP-binding protein [bacterium]|nr:ABC transporter ATP-binding protein [bacterium]
MPVDNVIVSVRDVRKKFCRNLRRSMAYGLGDLGRNLVGLGADPSALRRDEFWALEDINFELRRGEVLGLIGINGSGKTTLLRLLAGIFPPDGGEIVIKGRTGALIALGAGFHPHMTGRENVYLNGTILGLSRQAIRRQFDQIVDFAEVGEFIEAPVSTYSSGMRVRLGFAIAMAIEPDLLLIDEVLAVGDLGFKAKCLNAISKLMRNSAVIFVSHSMEFVAYICTRVLVLDKGHIAHQTADVNDGIDYYYSRFQAEASRHAGSGKARVTHVRLSSGDRAADDQGRLLLHYGDSLHVQMGLTFARQPRRTAIRFIVWNKEHRAVAECYSLHCGFHLAERGSSHLVEILIPQLQLNNGTYSVSIIVFDPDIREILCRCDLAAEFQVATQYSSFGAFLLQGQWSSRRARAPLGRSAADPGTLADP